jgi:fructokinase
MATHDGYEIDATDTRGAGDASTAGTLASLADGTTDLSEILAFAHAVAAASTMATAAMAALPTRARVQAVRANYRLSARYSGNDGEGIDFLVGEES